MASPGESSDRMLLSPTEMGKQRSCWRRHTTVCHRPANCSDAPGRPKRERPALALFGSSRRATCNRPEILAWASRVIRRALAVGAFVLAPVLSHAGEMTYIFNAPESLLDKRYLYHWEVLRTALEETTASYGPFRMVSSGFMTEQRQVFELQHATGKLTIMYLSTTPDLERSLIPVRIAVDRNLSGYFVYLIRKENQGRFGSIATIDDLRGFSHGLGLWWIDVGILKSDGFKVVTGSSYDGLFEMLINGRFDCFPRSGVEVVGEYDQRKARMPDLHIEKTLLLYYPLPMYFWFSRTDEGRRLAARVEEGLQAMIRNRTFFAIFDKYFRSNIERLRLKSRRIFKVENPNLGPETPLDDRRLWFDPQTYR